MKKKLCWVAVTVLLLVSGLITYGFVNRLSFVRILSFDRYDNGNHVVNLLTWESDKKADEYQVIVYDKDQNIAFEETTDDTKINLDEVVFDLNERLMIEVIAKKKSGIQVKSDLYSTIWKEEVKKVAPVKSNRESGEVAGRKSIILTTITPGADIYYTIDGSDPALNGKLYEEAIPLKESIVLHAIAKKDGYEDSSIQSFAYEVTSTDPIVYLSPSTQEHNKGIRGSGYTNEEEVMNKITDVVEKQLKKNHVTVYRNKPTMTSKGSIYDSNKYDVDLHLAIHSNASPNSNKGRHSGVETWIYDETCIEAEKIAQKLQEAIMNIYYNRYGDRGVLYSVDIGGLGETDPNKVTNGILMELAFHDNWNDAIWMVQNIEKIGLTIADTIIDYYQ